MAEHADTPSVKIVTGGSGALERRAETLRLLVLADLAPGADAGEPLLVERGAFDDLFARLGPRLELTVADHLGLGDARDVRLAVQPERLESLRPDGLVEIVPELVEVMRARGLVEAALRGDIEVSQLEAQLPGAFANRDRAAQVRARLAAGAGSGPGSAASEPASADAIDSLLAKVDLPSGAAGTGGELGKARHIADLLASAVLPAAAAGADERRDLEALLAEMDARLTRQVSAILDHPAFAAFEEAWRGLRFLADACDVRQPVRLEVLATSKDDYGDDFFNAVFHAEYEGTSEVPLAGVVVGFDFDRSPADLERLQYTAKMAQSLQVPFLAGVSSQFFGIRQPKLLASLPDLIQKVRGHEYAKWNSFRTDELSLWIALAANRILLRAPFTSEAVRSFSFAPEKEGAPRFGSAVWALASALARGFATGGIRFPLVGRDGEAVLEELPTVPYSRKQGTVAYPLEVLFDDRRGFELTECGFAALTAQPDSDVAYFQSAPTLHAPKRYDQEEATRESFRAASLPYQMFAAMASHTFDRAVRELDAEMTVDEIVAACRNRLLAFLGNGEDDPQAEEVEIEVHPNEEQPEVLDVVARLKPGFAVYGGEVDLVIGTQLAR